MKAEDTVVQQGAHAAGGRAAERKKNRLAGERSPYLKQHEDNPVDWWPWSEAALQEAKKRDVPLFVSVGYSSCYWCHVMERECFEDEEVAAALGAFVCCKVDREQRPDLDRWLMDACLALNGSGGWPLNVLLTPQCQPFWAGTYVPKPMLLRLAHQVSQLWSTRRSDVAKQAAMLSAALDELNEGDEASEEDRERKLPKPAVIMALLRDAAESFAHRFDTEYGGFGNPPKFPTPHNLTLLLRLERRFGAAGKPLQRMAEDTLLAMCRGGLWDHVGGGFHRYATDRKWLVPHFEKMLYDQAGLGLAYTEAYQATGMDEYEEVARRTFGYVVRCLGGKGAAAGAFYSAEDAESEGVEGKFYLWDKQQVREVLGADDATLFLKAYGCLEPGTPIGHGKEPVALHQLKRIELVAEEAGKSVADTRRFLSDCLERLFAARERRAKPGLDDNVLADWNCFMAVALARGARVFGDRALAEHARNCVGFVLQRMCSSPGDPATLQHHWKDGEASVPGILDDFAYALWACCEVYQATFDSALLADAARLAHIMDERFSDSGGGFYSALPGSLPETARRKRDTADSAMPSGSSAALMGLLALWLLAEDDWAKARAERLVTALWCNAQRAPLGHTQLLAGFDVLLSPQHVTIRGTTSRETAVAEAHNITVASFIPTAFLRWDSNAAEGEQLSFQVCTEGTCLPPVNTVNDVILQLLGKKTM